MLHNFISYINKTEIPPELSEPPENIYEIELFIDIYEEKEREIHVYIDWSQQCQF